MRPARRSRQTQNGLSIRLIHQPVVVVERVAERVAPAAQEQLVQQGVEPLVPMPTMPEALRAATPTQTQHSSRDAVVIQPQ